MNGNLLGLIGNFDPLTDKPANRETDTMVHREVALSIMIIINA